MSEQEIELKSVYDLRVDAGGQPIRYFIPAYQRGYRWEPQQVTQLLEDIREFSQRESPQPEEFYCLQPLVLRLNDDGAFEVVDGQQRLTTLLLILRHFNDRLAKRYQQSLYTLAYETRPELLAFLDNRSEDQAQSNIDFFHVDQAVKTIEDWFENRDSEVETIKSALLNQAKVIWFRLAADEDPVNAFTRLNVGKIPLSNGELIRALFLRRPKCQGTESSQLRIAYEWDQLEKALQDNDFWCFLSNDTEQRGNRIGFLFDLIAREDGMRASADAYATFHHFSNKLNDKSADPDSEWLSVKRAFMQLEEWFKDRWLYHLTGYLIWTGAHVSDLRKLAAGRTKRAFKQALRSKVFEQSLKENLRDTTTADEIGELLADRTETWQYGRQSSQIRSLLLLFNLATLLRNRASNQRFQFEGFKRERWDIEHVRSIADAPPGSLKGQLEWLGHCEGYLRTELRADVLQAEINEFRGLPAAEATAARFDVVYESVLRHFRELNGEEPDHSIANLVLLDASTNRSYKNAVFAVKRQRVLELDRDGVFVPLCTRNVFLKCYSSQVDHAMFWTQADSESYREAVIETLQNFFEGGWVHE